MRGVYREGKSFGNLTLGSGNQTLNFTTIKPGIVEALELQLAGKLNIASSTHTFSDLTGSFMGAQSADDLDPMLDAIFGAMTLDIGGGRKPVVGLLPSFLRGWLAAANQLDIVTTGTAANGASITTTATAFTATINIPLGLAALCEDLESCKQGSAVFKDGFLQIAGFTGTTASFTAANADTLVASLLSCTVSPVMGQGDSGYVGPYWDCQTRQNLTANGPTIGDGLRLLLLDTGLSGAASYTIRGPVDVEQLAGSFFQNQYKKDWVTNPSAPGVQFRGFPLMYIRPGSTIDEFDPRGITPYILASGVSTVSLMDVILHQDKSEAAAKAATNLGGNAGFSVAVSTPTSRGGIGTTNPRRAGLAGVIVRQGTSSAKGVENHANPASIKATSVLTKKLA